MNIIKLSEVDPQKVPIPFKAVACLSSSHITSSDSDLLSGTHKHIDSTDYCPNLIGKFEYGWFMSTHIEDGAAEELLRFGFSKELVIILTDLWYKNIYYVCFDADGYILDGYPTWNW